MPFPGKNIKAQKCHPSKSPPKPESQYRTELEIYFYPSLPPPLEKKLYANNSTCKYKGRIGVSYFNKNIRDSSMFEGSI